MEYEKLISKAILTELRIQKAVVLVQITLEIIMFFPIYFLGQLFVPLSKYLVDYLITPSILNIIIITLEYVLYKKLKNLDSKIYCISTGFILIFAVIYTVHVSFYPLVLLFCVPMLMSSIYGNKKITGILCAESIIAKLFADILLGTSLASRDMNEYHAFSDSMSILNMLMFVMVMIILFGFLSIMIDIEDKKRSLSEELEYEKNHDKITGLLNRHALENIKEEYANRNLPKDVAVFVIDINGLKTVNDTLGHEVGDELIIGVSKCLLKSLSPYGKVYRQGGDEFVALIYIDKNEVRTLHEEIQKNIAYWRGEKIYEASVSVGYALMQEGENLSLNDMLTIADNRMYEAKRAYYNASGTDKKDKVFYNVLLS